MGTLLNRIKELNEGIIQHEQASGGDVFGKHLRMVGPVNVDVAVVGIDGAPGVEAFLQPSQPQDTGGDEVPLLRTGIRAFMPAFPRRDATGEDHSSGSTITYLISNLMEPPWGSFGSLLTGPGVLAIGHWVGLLNVHPLVVNQFFLAKRYNEHILRSF